MRPMSAFFGRLAHNTSSRCGELLFIQSQTGVNSPSLTQNSSKCLDLVNHSRENLQTRMIQYHSQGKSFTKSIHEFPPSVFLQFFFTDCSLFKSHWKTPPPTGPTGAPWYVRFVPLLRQLFHPLRQVAIQRSVDQGLGQNCRPAGSNVVSRINFRKAGRINDW